MQRAYQAYKDKGVVFLGAFATSKEKDIRKFVGKFDLTYPVGVENGIAEALGAKGIPRTFFISKDMRVIERHSGTISFKELEDGIKKILVDDLERHASRKTEEEIAVDC